VAFDSTNDYPLGTRRPELVSTPGGTPLGEVTLDAVRAGTLRADEIRATPETLRLQAEVARASDRTQLAENLERAAELAAVPDELLLEVYTALRPRRATAPEAASVYGDRGLLADG
jgi:propanediol dehydratase small subunit